MNVRRMENPVMAYAWGSRDGIAGLQRRPPAAHPEAELWMGAHSLASSTLAAGADGEQPELLDAAIAADPERLLGADVVERFGPRLPFLLKVLSADRPLSLQVHPDAHNARRGYDAENAAGLDPAAPNRSYRDPYAKPELVVALTRFEVLHGFRAAAEAAASLATLQIPRLQHVVDALQSGTPTGAVFLDLLDWPEEDRAALVSDVRAAVQRGSADRAIGRWIDVLATEYPRDPAVVGALLLNYLELQPDQAIHVLPGQIHGYLHGTALEIVGSSDNVVRAGLTGKHVDVAELRSLLALQALAPAVIEPQRAADGEEVWTVDQPEFRLSRFLVRSDTRTLQTREPEILLCVEGNVDVASSGTQLSLDGGASVFVPAEVDRLTISGDGVVVRATPGTPVPRPGQARRRGRGLLGWLAFALVAILGSVAIRTYVLEAYRIPSDSMEQTLHSCGATKGCHADRIMVNKLAYKLHGIHHGDIVVFKPASAKWISALGKEEDVVKRVIGLPGDTVACCDAQGRVMRNGVSLNESYVYQDDHRPFGPIKVPAGDLWVMGDHRSDSSDSRYNGPIKESSVVGHAFLRIWPISRIGLLH